MYTHKPTSVLRSYGMQGIGASGDNVLIDDFKVSTTCKSDTMCDNMVTGETCEFGCKNGYSQAKTTNTTRTCDSYGTFTGTMLECMPVPPTITAPAAAFEIEERSKPGENVGIPITGTTASPDQTILWYIKADGNSDDGGSFAGTKDATGNFLPVFRVGICDGQIKVANALLNYAYKTQYVVTIVGKTDGDDRAVAEVQVTINVLNKNDPPTMDPSSPFLVDENSPVGT